MLNHQINPIYAIRTLVNQHNKQLRESVNKMVAPTGNRTIEVTSQLTGPNETLRMLSKPSPEQKAAEEKLQKNEHHQRVRQDLEKIKRSLGRLDTDIMSVQDSIQRNRRSNDALEQSLCNLKTVLEQRLLRKQPTN